MVLVKFFAHNYNKDSLLFTMGLTDKNAKKERHPPYGQLLLKGSGNSENKDVNESNDRRNFKGKTTKNEQFDKEWSDRNGAESRERERPRFLMDR